MLAKKYSLFDGDNESLLAEWADLAKKIRQHNIAYEQGKPIISDEEYDALKLRLFEIERIIGPQPKSPLYEVGSEYGREKVPHIRPMLSLDHGFGVDAIHVFIKKLSSLECTIFPLVAEYKVDGVAISMRYHKGLTVLTRGDGKKGVDVTGQFEFMEIPKDLNMETEVRGELFMTFAEFAQLEYKFASPRNACAALIQSKAPLPWLKAEFAAYQIFGPTYKTYLEMMEHLEALGFKTPLRRVCFTVEDCIDFFKSTYEARINNSLPDRKSVV